MNHCLRRLALGFFIVLLIPTLAFAGKITGILASPNPTMEGQEVSFTIEGTGSCDEIRFNPGDGSADRFITNAHFPETVWHTFETANPYQAAAQAAGTGCSGFADVVVTVEKKPFQPVHIGGSKGKLERLLEALDGLERISQPMKKSGAIKRYSNPVIETAGDPRPGALWLVKGSGFGSSPGELYLKGEFWDLRIDNIEWWRDYNIFARIPDDITGVPQHNVWARVVNKGGYTSNQFKVTFGPKCEVRSLGSDDPSITIEHCGDDGNANACQRANDSGSCVVIEPLFISEAISCNAPSGSIRGCHANCCGAVGNDSGVDKYRIHLWNGWGINQTHTSLKFKNGEGGVKGPNPPADGPLTHWETAFTWWVSPCDEVGYGVVVYISGPEGVPHDRYYKDPEE